MIKQIIVIRRDLGMRRGKEIAQGSHASMAFLTKLFNSDGSLRRKLTLTELQWIHGPFTKIVVQVPNEEELMRVYHLAQGNLINANLIEDNGATEFGGVKTCTAVAIGPEDSKVLDPLFRDLKLY